MKIFFATFIVVAGLTLFSCAEPCDQFCDRIIYCQNLSDNACMDLCEQAGEAAGEEMNPEIVDCLEGVECQYLRTKTEVVNQSLECYDKYYQSKSE
ncbi:MAG: hypothetical protein Kow0090_05190 [Myxococcota bacterium]